MRFTAATTHERRSWVARCSEVEVTSQGETLEQTRANLAEALVLYIAEPADSSGTDTPLTRT